MSLRALCRRESAVQLMPSPAASQTSVWSPAPCRHSLERPPAFRHWAELATRVQQGEASAMAELYRLFLQSVRQAFSRQLGSQDLDDVLHDSFLIVVQSIRRGELREPERLLGFVWTVARRRVAAHIETVVQQRCLQSPADPCAPLVAAGYNPEQEMILRQREEIAHTTLDTIGERDRQILVRFYLLEQSSEEICRDLGLSKTQFRLLKSRAKARFSMTAKRNIRRAAAFRMSAASAAPE